MSNRRYVWAAPGDVNAFFGLMLDNVADLILTVGLLAAVFGFPANFALRYMVPGTAIGVFVGDLLFFALALRLARRTGRNDITAMPLGLDTPSTFGMVFFVLGPAFSEASKNMTSEAAASYTWKIGICAIFISGLFKVACAFASGYVRNVVPRAGLLGSLTAIALVLISFLPLVEVLHTPVIGLVALSILLTALVARLPLPGRVPGALGALLIAGTLHYLMAATGLLHQAPTEVNAAWMPTGWLEVFRFGWMSAMTDSLKFMPVVLPFALATVVGGIDCTESAAAAGDEYDTRVIVGVDALATLIGSLCGGVIQTTAYIGHPAYKAMGGRAAYTLATALFVGSAGVLGYFGYLYAYIPKPTVFPILIFIGLEITAQSFKATKQQHYPAVALACVPALAALAMIYVDNLLGDLGRISYLNQAGETVAVSFASLSEERQTELGILRMLANGFILTSLLWASMLAAVLDRNLRRAAVYLAIAGCFSSIGLIHSPFPGSRAFLPWTLPDHGWEMPLRFTCGYLISATLLWGWDAWIHRRGDAPPT